MAAVRQAAFYCYDAKLDAPSRYGLLSKPIPLPDIADTSVPSGSLHEIVGVGTPKASHVNTASKEMFTNVFMGATRMLAGSDGSRKL